MEDDRKATLKAESGGKIYAAGSTISSCENAALATGQNSLIDISGATVEGNIIASRNAQIRANDAFINVGIPKHVADEIILKIEEKDKQGVLKILMDWAIDTGKKPSEWLAISSFAEKIWKFFY